MHDDVDSLRTTLTSSESEESVAASPVVSTEPVREKNWLAYGDRGEEVRILQENLNKVFAGKSESLVPDGTFGKLTMERLKEFQKIFREPSSVDSAGTEIIGATLVDDGLYGEKTSSSLESIISSPEKIALGFSRYQESQILVDATHQRESLDRSQEFSSQIVEDPVFRPFGRTQEGLNPSLTQEQISQRVELLEKGLGKGIFNLFNVNQLQEAFAGTTMDDRFAMFSSYSAENKGEFLRHAEEIHGAGSARYQMVDKLARTGELSSSDILYLEVSDRNMIGARSIANELSDYQLSHAINQIDREYNVDFVELAVEKAGRQVGQLRNMQTLSFLRRLDDVNRLITGY